MLVLFLTGVAYLGWISVSKSFSLLVVWGIQLYRSKYSFKPQLVSSTPFVYPTEPGATPSPSAQCSIGPSLVSLQRSPCCPMAEAQSGVLLVRYCPKSGLSQFTSLRQEYFWFRLYIAVLYFRLEVLPWRVGVSSKQQKKCSYWQNSMLG